MRALHLQGKKQLLLYVTFAISEFSAWGGTFQRRARLGAWRRSWHEAQATTSDDDPGRRPRRRARRRPLATTSGDDHQATTTRRRTQATTPGDDPGRRPPGDDLRTQGRRPPGDDLQATTLRREPPQDSMPLRHYGPVPPSICATGHSAADVYRTSMFSASQANHGGNSACSKNGAAAKPACPSRTGANEFKNNLKN